MCTFGLSGCRVKPRRPRCGAAPFGPHSSGPHPSGPHPSGGGLPGLHFFLGLGLRSSFLSCCSLVLFLSIFICIYFFFFFLKISMFLFCFRFEEILRNLFLIFFIFQVGEEGEGGKPKPHTSLGFGREACKPNPSP